MQHPEIVGCNNIDDYDIWYRPTSSASDDWKVIEGLSASSTSYTLRDLDSGDYVVRVVVTNDDDLSSFTELFYGPGTFIIRSFYCTSNKPTDYYFECVYSLCSNSVQDVFKRENIYIYTDRHTACVQLSLRLMTICVLSIFWIESTCVYICTADTTTTVTPAQPSKSPRDGSNSSSIGLIVGAVVGVLLLVILLAIMAFILYRWVYV